MQSQRSLLPRPIAHLIEHALAVGLAAVLTDTPPEHREVFVHRIQAAIADPCWRCKIAVLVRGAPACKKCLGRWFMEGLQRRVAPTVIAAKSALD